MGLRISTAQELYNEGKIDILELNDENSFLNKKVIQFPDEKEGMRFVYTFVHNYLVPKYGRQEASKFPMAKTGPAREDLLDELLGVKPKPSLNPVWFAIPEYKFLEVEEFLKQYQQQTT